MIIFIMCIVLIKIYYLQILQFKENNILATLNHIQFLSINPNRGNIYDRNGILLAWDRIIYQLELIPEKVNNIEKTLYQLKPIIDLTDEEINLFKEKEEHDGKWNPIVLKNNLNYNQIVRLSVSHYLFPDIKITTSSQRYYPYGSILAHVIGYVSPEGDINKDDKYQTCVYKPIGMSGIENYYNKLLYGIDGYKKLQVNNTSRVVRQLDYKYPEVGKDIWLTIDLELQQYIYNILAGERAIVIVSDPNTGEIVAFVSTPSYNPNLFVNGVSQKTYEKLSEENNKPLYNRGTQAVYPPASTIKPYMAIAALSTGILYENTKLLDARLWKLPGSKTRYYDWKKKGLSYITIRKALEESSDTFFYQVAYNLGIHRISEWMQKFGFGILTGIDLPKENPANVPTREWKKHTLHNYWYTGDTIPLGIGQGYFSTTPLQIHKALITLISNGLIKIPHLLRYICVNNKKIYYHNFPDNVIKEIKSSTWKIVKDGMYGVANSKNGTAFSVFNKTTYKIAAKSGTAQLFSIKKRDKYNLKTIAINMRDHKLMNAFAPYDKPTIAITLILENGGCGKQKIGHIMRNILDHIILGK
ncbi:transpeptidase [Candidatus Ishikawaella capsulata Mpkobe]|uniref:Penicillin-binding protein 2 n=1 Tax=Candidatus Ishikawaella capsulata Mpkobe TaxID=476281 RepID=C5WDE7_9ENTR|nr:transpeptidase [Candidatus Ishikawaella capsulata Mpkobe]